MCLASVVGASTSSGPELTAEILGSGHRFQMVRVDAAGIPAEMVYVKSFGDWAE
jgi:hypothetical protein